MTKRRYSEEEVAAIFGRATEAQETAPRQIESGQGMTLEDLHAIGQEVGIPPDLVTQAAMSLDQGGKPVSRTVLGLPIGVGRTIDLGRKLTDEEWERLVVDLRETFDARGTVRQHGSFRQWTNGNLHALLEPTATGHRVRLGTVKGSSRRMMFAGMALLGVAAATTIAALLVSDVNTFRALASPAFLSVMGIGMFGMGALRLPAWREERRRQMEGIATRLSLAVRTPSSDPSVDPTSDEG